MKKQLKNMKGITLVALIITIIVLLILAVVAITSISKSNIIKHAQNGRDAYEQSKNNEAQKLAEYEIYLNENNPQKNSSGKKDDSEIDFYDFIFAEDGFDVDAKDPSVYYIHKDIAENSERVYELGYKNGKFDKGTSWYYVVEIRNVPKDDTELNQILTDNSVEISEYSQYKNEIQKFLFSEDALMYGIGKDDTGEYVVYFKDEIKKIYKIGTIADERIANTGITSADLADIQEGK